MSFFRGFGSDIQERVARWACYLTTGAFAVFAFFVFAYPASYPVTVLVQSGLIPAVSWVSYYMTYKLYQKNSLLQYFAIGLGLVLVGCFSCYVSFLMSGRPSEQFISSVAALVVAAVWFGYGAGICLLVKLLRRHR